MACGGVTTPPQWQPAGLVHTLSNLPHLTTLDIAHSAPASARSTNARYTKHFFQQAMRGMSVLTSLSSLSLSGSGVTSLPAVLPPSLTSLTLDATRLRAVTASQLAPLSRLTALAVTNSPHFKSLPADAVAGESLDLVYFYCCELGVLPHPGYH